MTSIFTAELYAILKAVEVPMQGTKNLAICTDSLSSINSIRKMYTPNPIVNKIHEKCTALAKSNTSVSIIFNPSHVGIKGNENADHAAKEARCSDLTDENIQLFQDI
ncbi:uncharacterized protein LOC126880743 [Diabrotica virgifera virgifera]|uniref:RNase H type-1 domain-containing protein n=1 Tax=Diabrotica virgifera virgifera TaxID=50390 RepID=A0ABM5JS32_DIAVI|nr:uncharacterized protein LOC126880743 [Diabrotica virgifera virgifera]